MSKNSNAGKHPSYEKRGMTPAQIKNKKAYDSEYQKSPDRVKYREELNAKNRELQAKGKGKVGDKKDVSHKKSFKNGGSIKGSKLESQSKNRARK
jgi:hypothetical protein